MKTFVLPLALAALGTGGGVAGAMFLGSEAGDGGDLAVAAPADVECLPGAADDMSAPPPAQTGASASAEVEFVKLDNQFVVPVVERNRVEALVVLSLGLAVPQGRAAEVRQIEPKLRDAFLSVLFEHANAGHFGPGFTRDESLRLLKRELRDTALGSSGGLVSDILITEIARQEA